MKYISLFLVTLLLVSCGSANTPSQNEDTQEPWLGDDTGADDFVP